MRAMVLAEEIGWIGQHRRSLTTIVCLGAKSRREKLATRPEQN